MPTPKKLIKDYIKELEDSLREARKDLEEMEEGKNWSERDIKDEVDCRMDMFNYELGQKDLYWELGPAFCRYVAGRDLQQRKEEE